MIHTAGKGQSMRKRPVKPILKWQSKCIASNKVKWNGLLGKVITITSWPRSGTWATEGFPLPPLYLELCAFSYARSCPSIQTWDRNMPMRLFGLGAWLNPAKDSCECHWLQLRLRCKFFYPHSRTSFHCF